MSCGCGNSNCTGCSQCNDPNFTVRPCSPLANCGNIQAASPLPYYQKTPTCQEDHCQQIFNTLYATAIKNTYSWNIPVCDGQATLYFSDLKVIPIGSYIWNPTYGYFEVIAFDHNTGQVTILNHCNEGNAAVGTNVPACTPFVVVAAPVAGFDPFSDACVAIDFTAPADGDCIDITITNLGTIATGDQIQIGTGRYRVSAIVSPTIITICNDGLGITPGTAVIALDSAGNYQYCIAVVTNCCVPLQDEIDTINGLITGIDASIVILDAASASYNTSLTQQRLGATGASAALGAPVAVPNAGSSTGPTCEVIIQNTSTIHNMVVMVTKEYTWDGLLRDTGGQQGTLGFVTKFAQTVGAIGAAPVPIMADVDVLYNGYTIFPLAGPGMYAGMTMCVAQSNVIPPLTELRINIASKIDVGGGLSNIVDYFANRLDTKLVYMSVAQQT